MLAEISAGFGSAKAAFELLKGIQALKSETEVNGAVIDIQRHVVDTRQALSAAQDAYSAAVQREETLREEVTRLKDWSAEKQRYEHADAGQGVIAYRPKEGMEAGEPSHWLCPQCFQEGKPRILQPEKLGPMVESLHCNSCKTQLLTRGSRHHAPARR